MDVSGMTDCKFYQHSGMDEGCMHVEHSFFDSCDGCGDFQTDEDEDISNYELTEVCRECDDNQWCDHRVDLNGCTEGDN